MTGVFGVAGIPAGVEGGFGMLSSLPNAVHCTSQIIILSNVNCCSSHAQAVSLFTQL
jgi:hypothetical protein